MERIASRNYTDSFAGAIYNPRMGRLLSLILPSSVVLHPSDTIDTAVSAGPLICWDEGRSKRGVDIFCDNSTGTCSLRASRAPSLKWLLRCESSADEDEKKEGTPNFREAFALGGNAKINVS